MQQEIINTVLDPLNRCFFSLPFQSGSMLPPLQRSSCWNPFCQPFLCWKFQINKPSVRKWLRSFQVPLKKKKTIKFICSLPFCQVVVIRFWICSPWIPNEGRCSAYFPLSQRERTKACGRKCDLVCSYQDWPLLFLTDCWWKSTLVALWRVSLFKKTNLLSATCSHRLGINAEGEHDPKVVLHECGVCVNFALLHTKLVQT